MRAAMPIIDPWMRNLQSKINRMPLEMTVKFNNDTRSVDNILRDTQITRKEIGTILTSISKEYASLNKKSAHFTEAEKKRVNELQIAYGALYAKSQFLKNPPLNKLAKSALNTASAFYEATGASDALNVSLGKQNLHIGNLISRTLIYTGLFRAVSMLKSVRDVTAEFELQEVALGAIIQDTERASELFSQIKAAAFKSPFQIKDLVTYTKQLAAYRLETEELFDTTQRLADVSAGLGVDMNRLILAYGQVRAASVLRGQELRQFTEAGVPLVEELAKKFSQLRGEMVSTSEVFELISDRAVPFAMVKEIFEDMTNAGGVFYQMQEKQAETLKGQWSNLKDAVSIMYDEIGNTSKVRAGMEKLIEFLTKMAKDWRKATGYIEGAIVALVTYKVVMAEAALRTKALTDAQFELLVAKKGITVQSSRLVAALAGESAAQRINTIQVKLATAAQKKYRQATLLTTRALYRLLAALAANPWTALAIGISAAVIALVRHNREAQAAEKHISRLTDAAQKFNEESSNLQQTEELVSQYKELVNKENRTVEETKKLKAATDALSKAYPSAILGVNSFTGALELNVDKISEVSEASAKASEALLIQTVTENEAALKRTKTQIALLQDELANGRISVNAFGGIMKKALSEEQAEKTREKIRELTKDVERYEAEIQKANESLQYTVEISEKAPEDVTEMQKKLLKFSTKFNNQPFYAFTGPEVKNFTKLSDAIDETVNRYEKYSKQAKAAKSAAEGKSGAEAKQLKNQAEKAQAMADLYYSILEYYNATDQLKVTAEDKSSISILKEEIDLLKKVYDAYEKRKKVSTTARSDIEKMFGDSIRQLRFGPAFSGEDLSAVLKKYRDALASLPKTDKDVISLAFEIDAAIGDQDLKNMEDKLKDLAERVSRSETARNFFNDILSRTGDQQLAADMTVSVYGEVGDDLKRSMVEQVLEVFKGIDVSSAINYNTLEIDYRKLSDIYNKQQNNILESNRKTAKDLIDNGLKVTAEQIQSWYKELEGAKTYATKRVEIARKTAEEIRKIESSSIPEAEKANLIEQYKRRDSQEAKRLAYESFKNSPMYVQLFEDLDNASTAVLSNMRERLIALKSEWKDLTPEQLKELSKRLSDVDKQLAQRNPFRVLSDSIKQAASMGGINAYKKTMDDVVAKEQKRIEASGRLEVAINDQKQAQDAYNKAVAEYGEDSSAAKAAKDRLDMSNRMLDNARQLSDQTEDDANETARLSEEWQQVVDDIDKAISGAQGYINAFKDVGSSVIGLLKSIGVDGDVTSFLSDEIGAIANALGSATGVANGLRSIITGDILNGVVQLATGIIDTISSVWDVISGGNIFKQDRIIKSQQDLLDNLADSYGRLENAQKRAFGTEYIQNYSAQLENLQAQTAAYAAQAEAERNKGKKADQAKIAEYERAQLDAENSILDLKDDFMQKMIGTDLTSAAQDFAESWIEAYKEFGSITSAMSDKFNEMIQNMITQSLATRIIESVLKPLFDQIDEMAADGELSANEIAAIAKQAPEYINLINDGMKNMVNELGAAGLNLRTTGQGLTGISKDIANASEESILGLASGINTQNFYISGIYNSVNQILAVLQGGPVNQSVASNVASATSNQDYFSYLPTIADNTASIVTECRTMVSELQKVIKPAGSKGSHWLVTS